MVVVMVLHAEMLCVMMKLTRTRMVMSSCLLLMKKGQAVFWSIGHQQKDMVGRMIEMWVGWMIGMMWVGWIRDS